ncbi:MAG: sodium/solute symporter [Thermoguttaceae bacterium]|jgi:SSS family solute:Na+ symporter|nr:sodium/solute symporter [Thermoguttaceae bacterium]
MSLHWLDISVFVAFFAVVVSFSLLKSRKEETSEDYFLAGRGLRWYLIGFSIVAANISTEQFVGMAGSAAGNVGLAVSGYQLLGVVTIVFVALFFLPRFLRAGIYTMPEYLEYRYHPAARGIMAFYTMVIYVGVLVAAVLYSGGLTLHTIFDMDLTRAVWLVGFIATLYTAWGGLSAVVWADLFQGSALLFGGLLTMVLGLVALGGPANFLSGSADRLHMVLPADHPSLPWTVLLLGLWIPNFYYCGLNQFIVQRTLAAKSLREGQLGILFAAALWLIVPFAVVMPGIMAWQLYPDQLAGAPDKAYPTLIRNLIPEGWSGLGMKGFIFAAISGAVISTLASLLNSASTIFTIDLYKRYWQPEATQRFLVGTGRVLTVLFMLVGCVMAPHLGRFGVFNYIQEFQGYISPGVLAAFVFGFVVKRAPPAAGIVALALNPPVYGLLHWWWGDMAFLNRMAITFAVILGAMAVVTAARPLAEPKELPVRTDIDLRPSPLVAWLGGVVIAAVVAFFVVFW